MTQDKVLPKKTIGRQKLKNMLKEILERALNNGKDKSLEEKNLQLEKKESEKKNTLGKILLKLLKGYRKAQEATLTKKKSVTEVEEVVKRSVFDIFPLRQSTKTTHSKVATIIESFKNTNNGMAKVIIKRLVQQMLSAKNKPYNIGENKKKSLSVNTAQSEVEEMVKRSVFDIFPRRQKAKVSTIIKSVRKTNNAMAKGIIKRLVQKLFSAKNKPHNFKKERNLNMNIIRTHKKESQAEKVKRILKKTWSLLNQ